MLAPQNSRLVSHQLLLATLSSVSEYNENFGANGISGNCDASRVY